MTTAQLSRRRPAWRVTQAVAGFVVSAVFAWLAFRNVRLSDVAHELTRARWRWLVPATALLLLSVGMRAVRWSLLFPARRRPAPSACFWATNVGYLANALLPFRAGELIRVIVLNRETGASRSQGLVTILVERVYDLFTIAVLALAITPWVPPGTARTSLAALSATTVIVTLGGVVALRSAWLRDRASRVVDHLPVAESRRGLFRTGAEALEPLREPRTAALVLVWSFASWGVLAASTMLAQRAFVRGLPWPAGILSLVATTYAQAIPSSAASVGVFEAAARQSLTVYGVPVAVALAFAIAYHAVSILPTVPLGIAGLGRMGVRSLLVRPAAGQEPLPPPLPATVEMSIVIPCLDEERTIGPCVESAFRALAMAHATGEVVVVDNGSTDRSAEIAEAAGARVIHESRPGYGSAYLAGLSGSHGTYILMGDGDGTYDFTALPAFLELARGGADLVMGSRFRGTILPGAMPWHHRWIGNPVLTGLLNLLFRTGVSDAHCGLRLMARSALPKLNLRSTGMEFASEMVISAKRAGLTIAETEIVYGARPSGSHSKLHSLRDGLRHVRYILAWATGTALALPAAFLTVIGVVVILKPGGTSVTDIMAGTGLITIAVLAVQAAVSLTIWRMMTIEGAAAGWLHRVIDRRVLALVATAIVAAAFASASSLDGLARHGLHHPSSAHADERAHSAGDRGL